MINNVLFKQIPKDIRLLAIGNVFRADRQGENWRLGAFFAEADGSIRSNNFSIDASCILGVGRKFIQEEGKPYLSGGYTQRLVLPAIEQWKEQKLGECRRLSRQLAKTPEVASQRCFVFQAGDLQVWIPKFELARKLFFHAGFLVRAAFVPNGLDMLFSVQEQEDVIHIHTPSRTGAPSQLLKIKEYRHLFGWLLLNSDVRRSFESIWQCINQEQVYSQNGYARWLFNFVPPISLAGTQMEVRGAFDRDSREILVWEITGLAGLKLETNSVIHFHHPALKQAVRGLEGGVAPARSINDPDIQVDVEEQPDEAKARQLINLPVEGLSFDGEPITKIAYKGHKLSPYGQKIDDEIIDSSSSSQKLGIGDDVTGGTIAPGEFQLLNDGQESRDEYTNRFVMLKKIIQQIVNNPGIRLLDMDVKPLPYVPRCSYHLIADEQPRCYLIATFRLEDGRERYLLEIDTTDKKKSLSSRVFSLRPGQSLNIAMDKILRRMIKNSLRWPIGSMTNLCESIYTVRHPVEGDDDFGKRMNSWIFRLTESLKSN